MTQNDLTAQFLEARSRSVSWTKKGFDLVIAHLLAHPRVTTNWDHGVPEHWFGIHWDGEDFATLSTDLPLVIVLKQAAPQITKLLDQWNLTVIVVDNWSEQPFRMDTDSYWKVFPNGHSDFFQPEDFTIAELVFVTMT